MEARRNIGIVPSLNISPTGLWRAVSTLAYVVMEVSWIVPGYRSLSRAAAGRSLITLFVIFAGILLSANLLTWITSRLELRRAWKRALSAVALLVWCLLALQMLDPSYRSGDLVGILQRVFTSFRGSSAIIPFEYQMLVFVTLLWLRGEFLAQSWIGMTYVLRSFKLGTGLYLVLGFLNVGGWQEEPRLIVFLFLISGLVAMASARTTSLGLLRGAREPRFKRTWIVSTVAAAMVVVGFAALLGVVASLNLSTPIIGFMRMLFGLLLLILILFISPLLLVMALILPGLLQRLESFFDFHGLAQRITEVLQALVGVFQDLMQLLQHARASLPDLAFLKPYLLWALLAALIVLVVRRVGKGWLYLQPIRISEDEVEELLDHENLLRQVRAGLRRSVRRLVSRLSKLKVGRRLLAAARIRRIYAHMMKLVASLDHPRPEAQTPIEYLSTLISVFPGQESDVRLITDTYNRVRYGQFPETRLELTRVEDAWRRVHSRGKEMARSLKDVDQAASEWAGSSSNKTLG